MDAERWARARRIFEDAAELETTARPEFLAARCGDDAELRREVESLLQSDDSTATGHWLDAGAATPAHRALAPDARIGGYRVVRLLGSGGMGSVFEVEQERPRRRVALKLMALGLRSPSMRRRFVEESETLARLQHGNIAQVYEVGEHPDPLGGEPLPFFAMELVRGGRDVLRWVEEEQPPTRRIVELLVEVCGAIHHGHVHGVIHRDIKPGNVLVDDQGRPRVIDFGIARWTGGGRDGALATAVGQVVGTLPYMSPEQIAGRDVDARSDVWSLGVLAYRLLGGRLPIAVGDDPSTAARAIQEVDPAPLGAISPRLRGDLEVVVAQALAKEPDRRYQSASELGADLRRVLDHQPVTARPPSALYQLTKLARRHRAAFAAAVVAAVALVATLAVVLVQNAAVRAERGRTERISAFLADVLSSADAFESRSPDHPVREALADAVARIERELGGDPLLEAPIRHVVGETYLSLSLIDAAAPHVERAVALRREHLGDDHPQTLDSLGVLALLRREQGRPEDALRIARTAVAGWMRHGDEHAAARAAAQHDLALMLKDAGDLEAAERVYRDVAEWRSHELGAEHPSTLSTLHNLGALLLDAERYDAARDVLEPVVAARTRALGADHPDTAISIDVHARLLRRLGQLDAAIAAHRQAREILAATLGADHSHTLAAAQHLAMALLENGESEEAAAIAVPAADTTARVLGPEDPRSLHIARVAAGAILMTGDLPQAEQRLRNVVERSRRALGADDPRTRDAIADLAFTMRTAERPADALELLEPAVRADLPIDRPLLNALLAQAYCLADAGRAERGERTLLRALEVARELGGAGGADERAVANVLASFHAANGNAREQQRWQQRVDEIDAGR